MLCEPEIASALTGITRSTIHALAADQGLRVVTKRLTRDDVYIADEAFFTGTAAEVTPIREVDNRKIGAGSRGPSPKPCRRPTSTWCMAATRSTITG